MGNHPHRSAHSLSELELAVITQALELSVPPGAVLRGVWWPGEAPEHRNYRLTMWWEGGTPLCSTWVAERTGPVYRLQARPATWDEIVTLLEALAALGVTEASSGEPIAEVEYDCRYRSYQLCFTALEDMVEGVPYRRWIFRRHRDGRPLSVGYVCETRRGEDYATLPGGGILRGNPWFD